MSQTDTLLYTRLRSIVQNQQVVQSLFLVRISFVKVEK